ncbi:MAG: antibiotic biosynthesis monooxygenase [Planctomycetota bacterium]|nr:antibiotic biosynthesis monooxygenase [Planctomycetota bacterium]
MSQSSHITETYRGSHYAVIFTSKRFDDSGVEYAKAAERMIELAAEQDGFLGIDSVRNRDGIGITVSYWRDAAAVRAWHDVTEHRNVQELGRRLWYTEFAVRVCRVERSYSSFGPVTSNLDTADDESKIRSSR